MFNKISIIATAATLSLAALTAPASAAEAPKNLKETKAQIIQRNGKTLYCVKEMITGSLIPKRTCMTATEWSDAGAQIKLPQDQKLAASQDFASRN